MRFHGRERELAELERIRRESETSSRFTVVMGRRRIGKTTLALRSAEGHRCVYLFVSRIAEPMLCERMQRSASEAGVGIVGRVTEFRDLLSALMESSRSEPLTIIIDEFQDLHYVNPSIFGDIQEVWDTHRDGTRANLVVCGSVRSMMVRLFEDEHQPLFGRATSRIDLRPFTVADLEDILGEADPGYGDRDLLTLYMLTGGVPEYVGVLMDSGRTTREGMLDAVASVGSVFLRDGRDLLVSEFGRDYRTYFSIMELIASGRNRRAEVDDVLGMDTGMYLQRLEREYSFIRQMSPVFSKPNSRNARWSVSDLYLRFYFRFINPNTQYMEAGRHDLLRQAIERDLESYEGRVLEDLFRQRIAETETYTAIGGYWNRRGTWR